MKLIKVILLFASLSAIGLFVYRAVLRSRPFFSRSVNQPTALSREIASQKNNNDNAIESAYANDAGTGIENILILGRPGESYIGSDLTDTIIVGHLNQEKKQGVLISLPRDFLVKNPATGGGWTKINSLYQSSGILAIKSQVEKITGLKIDRYAIIDLTAAQKVIDLVDGLNVYVPENIYDPNFPGPGYAYDPFIMEAGWRYLDGRNVLRYVRTRYTSANGDFDRMYRQQQILRLIKQKILELNPLWDFPTYIKIYNTLRENIITDLDVSEMGALWQAAKETKSEDILTVVIDKKETDLLTSGSIFFGDTAASCVWPQAGKENYGEIKKYIQEKIQ